MHPQGRSGGPNEKIHQNQREEYVGNNNEVINLDLTLGISTTPENYSGDISLTLNEEARRNLVNGPEKVCGSSIKTNGMSTGISPLKRNRRVLEEENSSRGAHQAAPSEINNEKNPLPSDGTQNLEHFLVRRGHCGEHVPLIPGTHDWERFYQLGRRHVLGPPATLKTITPCAACRLLRRRCDQECPFFPYFSPHDLQKFACVHKVFGASNVSKMLMEGPEGQRADVANSLVYEAKVRLRNPVYGCMGVISALQAELNAVKAENEILKYKLREANNMNMNMNMIVPSSSSPSSVTIAAPSHPPPPPPPPNSSSSSLYIQQKDSAN